MGDFNSKVGRNVNSSAVSLHGEDNINDNGERLLAICKISYLKIAYGFIKLKEIHLYTWV